MSTISRPEFVIFYAWQSDRPGNRARYLIQEAATEAAQQINADATSTYTVRIDQDTQGVPGLCDIPATILQKIDAADGFLCDLTYIATTQPENGIDDEFKERFVSNPNVLFELGYAFRSMDSSRLVCVMNEHYGPATEQIFDLAHRRFPLSYRMPDGTKTRALIKADLVARLTTAIRQLFPLGKRAELGDSERVITIRSQFEARIKGRTFHDLVRHHGAIAIAVIPSVGKQFTPRQLREQHLPPPGRNNWDREIEGKSVSSVGSQDGVRCAVAELRDDGVLLAGDTWALDPSFHPCKELIIPGSATEAIIIRSIFDYCKILHGMQALLPWHICISLLEVKEYRLLANTEPSRRVFSGHDLATDSLTVHNISDLGTKEKVASYLRPAIDLIWREFGYEGSYHYAADGTYTERLF